MKHPCRLPEPRRARLLPWVMTAGALLLASFPAAAQTVAAPAPVIDAVEAAEPTPAIAAFGVQFGFPAYRTATLSAGLQARFVGMTLRVGGGPGGLAFGLQARAYPPIPGPVPVFVGVGVDAYAGRIAPHAVIGLHLPVGERWRLDAEVGAAWVRLLDETNVAPYLGVGVSYAFAVDLAAAAASTGGGRTPGVQTAAVGCVVGPADPAGLDAALAATIRRFVADATATYGSAYRGLRYRTTVVRRTIDGDRAMLAVSYEGSVIEILTGREISASGVAEVDFRWDGCRWLRTGLRY